MASNDFAASPADIRVQWLPDGHKITLYFSLYNVVYLEDQWTLSQDYSTDCEANITFGGFEMTIRRVPDSTQVSGEAKITRTDSSNIPVRAYIEIKVHHQTIGEYMLISRAEEIIQQNGEMLVYIIDLPDINDAVFHGTLSVIVSFQIEGCHDHGRYAPKNGAEDIDGRNWQCSKI